MYAMEIKTKIEKLNAERAQFMAFDGLLSALRMHGQLLGREILVAQRNGELVSHVVVPERDALDCWNNNKYVNKRLEELATVGLGEIEVRALGDINDGAVCDCKVRKAYCIYSDYEYMNSPLRCMACFGPVPLYTLPRSYGEECSFGDEYCDIITWASDFESCHRLYMNDEVGERFAMDQMYKFDSVLTRSGLEICARIHKATGKKTYYFLRKLAGKSMEVERERKCPSCGGEWLLKKRLHPWCDFMCKKCQLVSNIAPGVYYSASCVFRISKRSGSSIDFPMIVTRCLGGVYLERVGVASRSDQTFSAHPRGQARALTWAAMCSGAACDIGAARDDWGPWRGSVPWAI